jgi:hypothetical protein
LALALCAIAYVSLALIPRDAKLSDDGATAMNWFIGCHIAVLCLTSASTSIFWHRFLNQERMAYTVKCVPPWIIFFYALCFAVVDVAFPGTGFEIVNIFTDFTLLIGFLFMISLDACDCPRRTQLLAFTIMFIAMVVGTALASLVWPDQIILHGTQHASGTGWVGQFTKNGMVKTAFYGMMSLLAPGMVTSRLLAWSLHGSFMPGALQMPGLTGITSVAIC